MSLIADVCNLMTEQAFIAATNKLYGTVCDTGDLGQTVLNHFRLSNLCTDADEQCCITDYINQYVLTTDSCTSTYSCSNIGVEAVDILEEAIIIIEP